VAASIATVAIIAGRNMNDLSQHSKAASTIQVAQYQLPKQPSKPVLLANQSAQYPLNKRINDYLQAHNSSVYTNGEANFQPNARVTAYSQK
jgi:sigma-E factor negative regulatory protein RseA